jgi:S-adenosylmethionine hydrolase
MAEALSSDAVIMASADPRAPGIPREPIAIHFDQPNMYLVCPNIGISTMMLERYTPTKAIRMNFDKWASSGFNGRDIYAPTAEQIVAGIPLDDLGENFPLDSLYNPEIDHGTVLHIDNYGNVKLYAYDDLSNVDYVNINGQKLPVVSNFKLKNGETVLGGELVATNGSSFGLVEIQAKADGFGAKGVAEILGIRVEDVLDFSIC